VAERSAGEPDAEETAAPAAASIAAPAATPAAAPAAAPTAAEPQQPPAYNASQMAFINLLANEHASSSSSIIRQFTVAHANGVNGLAIDMPKPSRP